MVPIQRKVNRTKSSTKDMQNFYSKYKAQQKKREEECIGRLSREKKKKKISVSNCFTFPRKSMKPDFHVTMNKLTD